MNNQIDIQAKLTELTRQSEALRLGKNKDTVMVCGIFASENHMSVDYPTGHALQEAIHEQANSLNSF